MMMKRSNIICAAAIILPLLAFFAMMSTTATVTTTSAIIGAEQATVVDNFSGDYADPNHPNCLRQVRVLATGTKALVSGTDGNPGCPIDGSGQPWKLNAIISNEDNTISVDFSPKGGPSSLQGVKTTKGILWADNNLWTTKIL
ncbi:hypothetical protein FRACYDRAFT_217988, partial [Fragilariopsis cylindrus CCMP1102]